MKGGRWMKKWLFGFLGVTLIVFCSVF
ncbi:TPA: class A sortase, partial [Enterococcus faecium]